MNIENQLSVEKQLEDLATYLEGQKDAILMAWRVAVDNDPRLITVSRMGRIDFEDNIPASLQVLSEQLRNRKSFSHEGSADEDPQANEAEKGEAKHAHSHGFHRWKEGYDIRELLLEWGHLHFCLVQVFNDYETGHKSANREAMNWARMALAGLMNGGFSQSVAEYYRLQQTEAQEIVDGLSGALQQVSQWEKQRGQVLQEAVHDLRGNLSAVQATTSILDDVSGPSANINTQNTVFEILQRGTSTLNKMLTELLDLARLEAGQEERQVEVVDVGALLSEICATHLSLVESKGLYLRGVGPSNLSLEGDAVKIHRIAQNLLLNAIKYTFQGGITVGWGESEPNQWYLSIQDTGPGITLSGRTASIAQELIQTEAPETNPKPNATQQTESRGEGVGLAIVKRLCGLLSAELEVVTDAEQGTTIRATFPRTYSD